MDLNEKINWTDIENITRNEEARKSQYLTNILPTGTYNAIIQSAEFRVSKKDDRYLIIVFTIFSPEAYKNRIINEIYMQTHHNEDVVNQAKYRLRQVCMAVIGKLADYPTELTGKKCRLLIKAIDSKDANGVFKLDNDGKIAQKNIISRVLSLNEDNKVIAHTKLNYDPVDRKPTPNTNNNDMDDEIPF